MWMMPLHVNQKSDYDYDMRYLKFAMLVKKYSGGHVFDYMIFWKHIDHSVIISTKLF